MDPSSGAMKTTCGLLVKKKKKKLDPVASGWPSCLKAITAVALLLKDADKLTLGQQTIVVAPMP